jgi:hypothetical protein|tara:strand:- start:1010 stop:1195 length:186 start_codon:yes stop_codon:yes gene_type:complete
MAYTQKNNPIPKTGCGRRRSEQMISPFNKAKGIDGKACWKGYKLQGTKKKGGRTVDNCVKM